MLEEIKYFRKDFVFENYSRIVPRFKDYEKITKVKMLEAIYKVYSDYNNIIDICTTCELKYLEKVLKLEVDLGNSICYEREILHNKFLIQFDHKNNKIIIPKEIEEYVRLALKNVNYKYKQNEDNLTELIVGYCKVQGTGLIEPTIDLMYQITGIEKEAIEGYIYNSKIFNYYVFVTTKNLENIGNNVPYFVYQDYYYIQEEIDERRKQEAIAYDKKIDIRIFKTLFYNQFDINNKKIKNFLDRLDEIPCYTGHIKNEILECSILNLDRNPLKDNIRRIYALRDYDLTEVFKLMDIAMDEMPSSVLNGLTPNEYKKIKKEQDKLKEERISKYQKQINANLSEKDADLFYKIYFGLLDFTNQKYKIKNNYKIYKQNYLNPHDLMPIINEFWKNKETLVNEFIKNNPYKFTKEELSVTAEFKKGIRGIFIIGKYENNYTCILSENKIYMIKGLRDNIDNIVKNDKLPIPVYTSILPFKDNLVFDGLLSELQIKMGVGFEKLIEKELNEGMKYYHL